ncbi:MAG: hypothetical protein ACJAVO_002269 [Parvibaculaceae bacterium]|jgi:hypothetical protein|nr:DUF2155 domain-containing protein [Parvibaculaceae bacterium]|tara:strand:- start:85 stop:525 length:441 start_codon:yes stop_codon:yes gene_type:complete
MLFHTLKVLFSAALLAVTFQSSAFAQAGDIAVFNALDKITARITILEIPIGGSARFGTLEIRPQSCDKRPPEETPETTAFVEVFDIPRLVKAAKGADEQGGAVEPKRIFAGWMFASSPGLNAVEHPVYDAWVIDCKISAGAASDDN